VALEAPATAAIPGQAGCLVRELTRKPMARMSAPAGILAIAAGLAISGCSGGGGGESVVFENAAGEYTYTVNVAEPTDFILSSAIPVPRPSA
jgi:hypothetical protein